MVFKKILSLLIVGKILTFCWGFGAILADNNTPNADALINEMLESDVENESSQPTDATSNDRDQSDAKQKPSLINAQKNVYKRQKIGSLSGAERKAAAMQSGKSTQDTVTSIFKKKDPTLPKKSISESLKSGVQKGKDLAKSPAAKAALKQGAGMAIGKSTDLAVGAINSKVTDAQETLNKKKAEAEAANATEPTADLDEETPFEELTEEMANQNSQEEFQAPAPASSIPAVPEQSQSKPRSENNDDNSLENDDQDEEAEDFGAALLQGLSANTIQQYKTMTQLADEPNNTNSEEH
jgi:hypothetical protein